VLKDETMKSIYNKLGLSRDNGLFYPDDYRNSDIFSFRTSQVLNEKIKPDALYAIDGKIVILFFKISAGTPKDAKKLIFKNCWNFNEAPIVIMAGDNGELEIYNGFNYVVSNSALERLSDGELDYVTIASGKIWELYGDSLSQDNRVDTLLLKNIKEARSQLINNGITKRVANSLIGRIIFIRYLIDREINILSGVGKRVLRNEDLRIILRSKEKTYELFQYLKKQFNGDVFPILVDEDTVCTDDLLILERLVSGVELSSGQMSLFDIYDFSIIPIEFISNIYEYFIGKEEQEEQGAYYTPTFLVDYALKNTVDKYFYANQSNYNCKILDPACGSGIFLVESLRKMIARYKIVHGNDVNSDVFKEDIKQILKDNIFGIDKDGDAIMVTIFSLCMTLLDYQYPKDIEDFKFPNLLHSNFFEADFFDLDAPFNTVIKKIKPNFIIGNPPYKRGGVGNLIKDYILARKSNESSKISLSNNEIAQAFMVRVSDFCEADTQVAFVVTSKVFYNLQASNFRSYLLDNFLIKHILELSSVRKEIFNSLNDKAVTPVSMLFYQYAFGENTNTNEIQYISVKPSPAFSVMKMFMIQKSDCKVIRQDVLKQNDWLWKTLVYGSFLDFNFVRRLKQQKTIFDAIDSKAVGISVGGDDENDATQYIGMPYVTTDDLKGKNTLFKIERKWEKGIAHRAKKREIFTAPLLLVGKGIDTKLNFNCALLEYDAVYTDSITGIKAPIKILKNINQILKSDYAKYIIFHTGTSIGIEREQVHKEKFEIPYLDSKFTYSDIEKSLIEYCIDIQIPWIMNRQYYPAFQKMKFLSTEIENYIQVITKHFNQIYSYSNQKLTATVHYSDSVIGIFFGLMGADLDSKLISWVEEKNIQYFAKLAGQQFTEKIFVQKDVKGFEKDGFYVVKPNEYKNWHLANAYLDLYEFKDAIMTSGMKNV